MQRLKYAIYDTNTVTIRIIGLYYPLSAFDLLATYGAIYKCALIN